MSEPAGTYDPNLGSDLDRMRQIVGDIDATDWLRPDAEYLALLAQETDWRLAAARMAESLAAQFGRRVDRYGDQSVNVSWSSRVSAWQTLAARLRAEVAAERANAASAGWASVGTVRADASGVTEYRAFGRGPGW